MNSPVSRSAQNNADQTSVKQFAQLLVSQSAGSSRRSSWQWLILVTAAIVNGLILVYPAQKASTATQTNTQTVLPPVSKSVKEHYASEIERYNKLLQGSHAQQDHIALADALANVGCREAATEAYKAVMSHDSQSHTHSPINSCNP